MVPISHSQKKHATVSKMFFLITKIHGIYGWCFRARRFGTAKRGVDPTTAGNLQNWLLSGNLLVEISNQWPFQEPIDWSYLPYIRPILKAYVREYPIDPIKFPFFLWYWCPYWIGLIWIDHHFPIFSPIFPYWNGHKLGDNHPHFWTNPSTLLASSHAPVTYLHTLLVTSQPYLPW